MALSEGDRLRFREWLTNNELDETVAHAILESMVGGGVTLLVS